MRMFENTLSICLLAKNAGENCKHAKRRSKHRGQLSLQFASGMARPEAHLGKESGLLPNMPRSQAVGQGMPRSKVSFRQLSSFKPRIVPHTWMMHLIALGFAHRC